MLFQMTTSVMRWEDGRLTSSLHTQALMRMVSSMLATRCLFLVLLILKMAGYFRESYIWTSIKSSRSHLGVCWMLIRKQCRCATYIRSRSCEDWDSGVQPAEQGDLCRISTKGKLTSCALSRVRNNLLVEPISGYSACRWARGVRISLHTVERSVLRTWNYATKGCVREASLYWFWYSYW